jgi:hypothetical protein
MGNPYNPYIVVFTGNNVFRNDPPVLKHDYPGRANSHLRKDLLDRGRAHCKNSYSPIREGHTHQISQVGLSALKYPAGFSAFMKNSKITIHSEGRVLFPFEKPQTRETDPPDDRK